MKTTKSFDTLLNAYAAFSPFASMMPGPTMTDDGTVLISCPMKFSITGLCHHRSNLSRKVGDVWWEPLTHEVVEGALESAKIEEADGNKKKAKQIRAIAKAMQDLL